MPTAARSQKLNRDLPREWWEARSAAFQGVSHRKLYGKSVSQDVNLWNVSIPNSVLTTVPNGHRLQKSELREGNTTFLKSV